MKKNIKILIGIAVILIILAIWFFPRYSTGLMPPDDPLSATEIHENDLNGKYQKGDVVWCVGVITETSIVGGAGRALLDGVLELSYSMGGEQGEINDSEGKTFLGAISCGDRNPYDPDYRQWHVDDFTII